MVDEKTAIRDPKYKGKIGVRMGKGVVTTAPHIVSSVGLGSCVAVTLYDAKQKIGGLAHIMLPGSASLNGAHGSYRCADTAIAALLKKLSGKGAARQGIVAKMVGGARMFSDYNHPSQGIGEQNIVSIKRILRTERIPLVGEDTGGHHGRSIEFHLDSGKLVVIVIGEKDKEI